MGKNTFEPKQKRYDNPSPSVTTILGVLRKAGLENWFKNNTAEFCDKESAKGKTIGKQIHKLIQDLIDGKETKLTTEYDCEVQNAVKSFAKFRAENPQIILKRAEIKLFSQKYGYNGTLDCLAIDGVLVIMDWKTGKAGEAEKPRVFDEYYAQVAAYVKAYNEVYETNITRAFIVVLAKDKAAYTIESIDEEFLNFNFENIFLPALKIYNAQQRIKKERAA